MNKLISILLIAIITSFIWRDAMIYSAFKTQQDFISSNQCKDRSKVVNECNGHCVLTERLSTPVRNVPYGPSEPILLDVKMEFFLEEVFAETSESIFIETNKIDYLNCSELEGYLQTQIKPPETV